MLLIQVNKYGYGLGVFGNSPEPGRNSFTNEYTFNPHQSAEFRRFDDIPRMWGKPFDAFELFGKRFVSYVRVPSWVLEPELKNESMSMTALICFYQNHEINVPFENWLQSIPMLRWDCADRRHIGVFVTDSGKVYVLYVQNREVSCQEIKESSWLRNGVVTPVTKSFDSAMAVITDEQKKLQEKIDKINTEPFDYIEQVAAAGVARFAKSDSRR